MIRRLFAPVAIALTLAFLGASCSSSHTLTVKAKFSDVGDLVRLAPVEMSDIQIGHVTDIQLVDNQAMVTMSIDPAAKVPQNVTARTRRTSLLGERIVDLVVPPNLAANAPLLKDNETIKNTIVRPDLEDFVQSGTNVLAPIGASEIATLVNEGYKGFGGRGKDLRTLLDNFNSIVGTYSQHTDEIRSVITNLNAFNQTLASHAAAQSQSITNTLRSVSMLRQESVQLQVALHALARLAVSGRSLLDAHETDMAKFFSQMRVILGVLVNEEGDITNLLKWAPAHNRNTQLVEFQQFDQVFQDFVICGMNDDPSDPARTCKPGGK